MAEENIVEASSNNIGGDGDGGSREPAPLDNSAASDKNPPDANKTSDAAQNKTNNKRANRNRRNKIKSFSMNVHPLFPSGYGFQDNYDLRNVLGSNAQGGSGWWNQQQQRHYNPAKKPRPSFTSSNKKKATDKNDGPIEDIVNPLKYCAVPLDYPQTLITEQQFEEILTELTNKILQADPSPTFHSCTLRNGAVLIYCVNDEAKEWIVNQMNEFTLSDGLKLKSGPAKDIILTTKISFVVPKQLNCHIDRCLQLMKSQNIGLRTDLWQILENKEDENGNEMTLAVDEDSFRLIKQHNYEVYLGLATVKFINSQHYNVAANSSCSTSN